MPTTRSVSATQDVTKRLLSFGEKEVLNFAGVLVVGEGVELAWFDTARCERDRGSGASLFGLGEDRIEVQ